MLMPLTNKQLDGFCRLANSLEDKGMEPNKATQIAWELIMHGSMG
jgi:hypothetical protein